MDIKLDPMFLTPPPSLSPDKTAKKDQDLKSLRESTREFEAIFVMEMYKSMRKSLPEGGLFEKDIATDIFQEMMDKEYARATAKGKGMGLGEAMYNQMKTHIINKK